MSMCYVWHVQDLCVRVCEKEDYTNLSVYVHGFVCVCICAACEKEVYQLLPLCRALAVELLRVDNGNVHRLAVAMTG